MTAEARERVVVALAVGVCAGLVAHSLVTAHRPPFAPPIQVRECAPADPAMPPALRAQFLRRCRLLPRYRPVGDWP